MRNMICNPQYSIISSPLKSEIFGAIPIIISIFTVDHNSGLIIDINKTISMNLLVC